MKSVILCSLVRDTKNAALTQTNSISFLNNKDSDFRSALLLSPVNKCQLSVASCDVEHQKPNHLSKCVRKLVCRAYQTHTSTVLLSPPLQAAHTPVAPVGSPVGSSLSLIPEDGLPPILISTGVKGGTGGHITGACPHPHHRAASSLLRRLLCLCSHVL